MSQEFSAGFLTTRRHGTASFSTRVSKFSDFTYLPGGTRRERSGALADTARDRLHPGAGVSSRRTLVGWVGLTTALLQAVCRLFASASNANASNVNNE